MQLWIWERRSNHRDCTGAPQALTKVIIRDALDSSILSTTGPRKIAEKDHSCSNTEMWSRNHN